MEERQLPINNSISFRQRANDFGGLLLPHIALMDQDDQPIDSKKLRKQLANAITNENYQQVIVLLMELIDANQGIKWYRITQDKNPVTHHAILIRDARQAKKPDINHEPFMMMAANYILATKLLLSRPQFEGINTFTSALFRNLFLIAKKNPSQEEAAKHFQHFNTVLVNIIADQLNIDFEEARQRLSVAKDFVNLENPAKDIVTLVQLKAPEQKMVTAFMGEIALTQLTPELIAKYQNRKSEKWYQILPVWQQDLIEKNIGHLLACDRVLPTQLRTILIGLRNSYQTVNGIIPNDINQHVTITSSMFRSGTIIYLGKDTVENQQINILQGEQLQTFTGTKSVLALTLNTDVNPTGNDKTIVEQSHEMMRHVGGFHANLALNHARRMATNDYQGINSILMVANQFINQSLTPLIAKINFGENQQDVKDTLTKVSEYIIDNQSFLSGEQDFYQGTVDMLPDIRNMIVVELQRIDQPAQIPLITALFQLLNIAMDIRYLTHTYTISDWENQNLNTGSLINLLVFQLAEFLQVAINSSCESGKDRDGLLMLRTAIASFIQALFGNYALISKDQNTQGVIKENIIFVSYSRHQQFMAGLPQGGTCGASGIKKDSKGSIPATEFPKEAAEVLIEEFASYNKEISVLADHTVIFFPFGDTDPIIQREIIVQLLKMQENRENSRLPKHNPGLSQRLSGFLQSNGLILKRTFLLNQTTLKIKSAESLSQILDILQKSLTEESQLVAGTLYLLGDTNHLLSAITKNLTYIIQFIKSAKKDANDIAAEFTPLEITK